MTHDELPKDGGSGRRTTSVDVWEQGCDPKLNWLRNSMSQLPMETKFVFSSSDKSKHDDYDENNLGFTGHE